MPADYRNHSDTPPAATPPTHAELLMEFASNLMLFRSEEGQAYASIPLGQNSIQVIPVQNPLFRDWVISTFYGRHQVPPEDRPLRKILRTLNAHALVAAERRRVHLRVANQLDRPAGPMVVLDLWNDNGEMVEISPHGWTVVDGIWHAFRHTSGGAPLPRPERPEDAPAALDALRSLLGLDPGPDWVRCLVWLLNALWPEGPHPILALTGPPASGKSTAARLLRGLIDPSSAPLFLLPLSERRLLNYAYHSWVLAFDHVSRIPWRIAEALSALSTGGGLELARQYDNADARRVAIQRPVILTIPQSARLVLPQEIAARALSVAMPPRLPRHCRADESVRRDFETHRPRILGALCDAISAALGRLDQVAFDTPSPLTSRLARALAAAPVLGLSEQDILAAAGRPFCGSGDPVVQALYSLASQRKKWTGTPTELLSLLRPPWSREWPDNPRGFSRHIRNTRTHLESAGVRVAFDKSNGTRRMTVAILDPRIDPAPTSTQENQ